MRREGEGELAVVLIIVCFQHTLIILSLYVQSDELSFDEGDTLYILEKVQYTPAARVHSMSVCILQNEDGWWKGRCGGREGLIPSNYSELVGRRSSPLPPLPDRLNSSPSPPHSPIPILQLRAIQRQ